MLVLGDRWHDTIARELDYQYTTCRFNPWLFRCHAATVGKSLIHTCASVHQAVSIGTGQGRWRSDTDTNGSLLLGLWLASPTDDGDDDADAKLILTAPLQRTGRDHEGIPYHVSKHHQTRPESLQPYTKRNSQSGWELPSVEADVYVWRYALIVVHTRKEKSHLRTVWLGNWRSALAVMVLRTTGVLLPFLVTGRAAGP